MKLFSNFTSTDRAILSGSTLILLVLSYLLYDDSLLFSRNKNNNLVPVGTLSTLQNDVRRKSSTDFVWLPSIKKDQIYNHDSIFTGAESNAAIQLSDGSVIQIQENSLVNINVLNGQMQLDLRFGQLTGTGKSTIRVKTNNDEYTIDGKEGKFEVNRSASGNLDVKVLSGKAEINGKKGRQNLKTNESLQISDSGIAKNEVEASIALTTKNDVVMHRKLDKEGLNFAWTAKGPLTQYQLEIAGTEDFKKLLTLQTTTAQSLTVTDSIPEGSYFWRVKGLGNLRRVLATSPVHKFYLSYLKTPTLTAPANDSVIESISLPTAEGLRTNLGLTWNGDDRLKKFHWQLSNDESFEEVLAESTITTKTTQITSLASGVYYARVRGIDAEERISLWSQAHKVTLKIEGEVKPPAPKIINLLTRFQIPSADQRTPSATAAPQAPELAWTSVEEAKNYHWEIASNPRFIGAKTLDLEDTKVAWTAYSPGKHYYRVYTRSELGQLSDSSEIGVVEVFGNQPVIRPIAAISLKETNPSATVPPKTSKVSWQPVPGAASYALQVDTNPEFSAPIEKEVASNESSIDLPQPGKYFVRVKAQNPAKQDISDFSNVAEAKYDFQITLKAPVLSEPLNKTTVFLQKDTEPYVWLEWLPVKDAIAYKLELSRVADFSQVLMSKELTETRFLIKNKVPYGSIFWRVRAIAPKDRNVASENEQGFNSDWSAWQFMILQQKNQGF